LIWDYNINQNLVLRYADIYKYVWFAWGGTCKKEKIKKERVLNIFS